MTRTIPGTLDLAALAALAGKPDPAQLHRPTTPRAMRPAILRLMRQGLSARDIARMLGLADSVVRALLDGERM